MITPPPWLSNSVIGTGSNVAIADCCQRDKCKEPGVPDSDVLKIAEDDGSHVEPSEEL